METKLTLKMDRRVIEAIKKYAKQTNRSVSKLAEDYFKRITSDYKKEPLITPLVQELSGVLSEKDLENLDYTTYLEKKYE